MTTAIPWNSFPGPWHGRLHPKSGIRNPKSLAAFSLIEVTLAIMVVTIGILSVMTLFGTGLEQSARSTDQTYAILFAEEVMSGMRARADQGWTNLSANTVLPPIFSDVWLPAPPDIRATGLIRTNLFYRQDYPGVLQASYRYRLRVTTNEADTVKGITLEIWNSHFGAVSISNALIYYTEVFNTMN